jgi:hypothetical protein
MQTDCTLPQMVSEMGRRYAVQMLQAESREVR